MILSHSIEINASPEKIFRWFNGLKDSDSYKAWHPDHVAFRWIKGEPFEEGSTVYFEQYLHGRLHKGRFSCTRIVPNRLIEYRPPFPLSIFMPGNQFLTEPAHEGRCIFTATINLRMDPLSKILNRKRIQAVERHMKEEGERLKSILENEGVIK
jgi:hypothetical protein